jgi:hypothetical protein
MAMTILILTRAAWPTRCQLLATTCRGITYLSTGRVGKCQTICQHIIVHESLDSYTFIHAYIPKI